MSSFAPRLLATEDVASCLLYCDAQLDRLLSNFRAVIMQEFLVYFLAIVLSRIHYVLQPVVIDDVVDDRLSWCGVSHKVLNYLPPIRVLGQVECCERCSIMHLLLLQDRFHDALHIRVRPGLLGVSLVKRGRVNRCVALGREASAPS